MVDRTQLEQDIKDFEARFSLMVGKMQTLHDDKRNRYTGNADPLENYLTCSDWIARMLDQQFPEAGAFVRSRGALFAMIARHGEKFQRLVTMVGQPDFLDPNQGEGEGITDTLLDIAIIALLEDTEADRLQRRALERGPIYSDKGQCVDCLADESHHHNPDCPWVHWDAD